jgi:hypothetical protein
MTDGPGTLPYIFRQLLLEPHAAPAGCGAQLKGIVPATELRHICHSLLANATSHSYFPLCALCENARRGS